MAAAATTPKNGLCFAWLDDTSDQDPNAKAIFLSIYEQVFTFTNPGECLELVESAEGEAPFISILVSGKYGQMLVHDRFQPLNQVKNIYVFCFDISKHNQWAQQCDKVRCVDSDFAKLLKCMQQDVQKTTKQKPQPPEDQQEQEQQQHQEPQDQEEFIPLEPERFLDDNNLYDQLALDLLIQKSDDNDGAEDFTNYCRTLNENNNEGEEQQYFKPDKPLKEWFNRELFFVNLNSTDLAQLWTLRWFIRLFYRQLTNEYEHLIKDGKKVRAYYGAWLNSDELDGMKHRIGKFIIFTELLTAYTTTHMALDSIKDKKDEQRKHKIIFEINVDTNTRLTVPYGEIRKDELLFWCGSRYRLMKIEFIESENEHEGSYWLLGLSLCPTLDTKQSIQTLYEYYLKNLTELKNLHHAFGRILMYKGLYYQAEKWLLTNNHYEDLAVLAIRQNQCEKANQYLEHLPEDSDDANLLRAYVNLLLSSDNIAKGRTFLMKICSEATDRIVRARANIALGFLNLIVTQQIDQALDHFTLGSQTLCKYVPDIHPDIAKSFIGIGYTHFVRHDIDEAEKYFQMALKIQKQSLTYNHPDIAKTRNGLAHCLSRKKQTIKQALKEFEYALNILSNTFRREREHHPEILATIHDIDKLRKEKDLHPRNTLLDYI
jgi:tetratricopeptide (TPR) repeat protein